MIHEPEPATLGFPRRELSPRQLAAPRPTPQPHRPKGRWFVGSLLVAACTLGAYNVWHSYFRYHAYGTVSGKVIQVSPTWDGSIRYLHVREGDTVRQGQLLAVLDNIEIRQKHARVRDELQVAQAQLEAETARLKWQSAFSLDQSQGSLVLYRELLSTLMREQAALDNARQKLRRAERTYQLRATAQQDLFEVRYEVQGLEKSVARLKEAVDELKIRSDQAAKLIKNTQGLAKGLETTGADQLKPFLAKLNALQAERDRLQELLDAGQIVAPTTGLVVKTFHYPGEACKTGDALVSILSEGSLEVVLYAPQSTADAFHPNDELTLDMDAPGTTLTCAVTRLGDQMEAAPEQIKRHYKEGERLLPVYLKPRDDSARWAALRIGSIVRLPR